MVENLLVARDGKGTIIHGRARPAFTADDYEAELRGHAISKDQYCVECTTSNVTSTFCTFSDHTHDRTKYREMLTEEADEEPDYIAGPSPERPIAVPAAAALKKMHHAKVTAGC